VNGIHYLDAIILLFYRSRKLDLNIESRGFRHKLANLKGKMTFFDLSTN
jgi:hypothetical protein